MWITFLPLLSLSSLPPIKVDEKKILLPLYFFFFPPYPLFILFYSLFIKEKLQNYPPCFIPRLTSLMTNECFICIYARALVCVFALRFYLIKEALPSKLCRFFQFRQRIFYLAFFSWLGLYSQKGGYKRDAMQVRRFGFPGDQHDVCREREINVQITIHHSMVNVLSSKQSTWSINKQNLEHQSQC